MNREFLDKRFTDYQMRPADIDRMDEIVRRVRDARPRYVLDVGCGSGLVSRMIKDSGVPIVVGIDFARTAMLDARSNDTVHGVIEWDLNTPYGHDTPPADFVLCTEVIEHIFNNEELLRTCHRLTKPDGHFLITTPNLASWLNRISILLGYQPFFTETGSEIVVGNPLREKNLVPGGHIRLYTARAMREMLNRTGFRIVEEFGISGFTKLVPIDRFFKYYFPGMASVLGFLCRRV